MKSIKFGPVVLPVVLMAIAFPVSAQEFVKYQCNEGKTFEVQYFPTKAWVKVDDLTVKLYPVASSEGIKYSNGRTLLETFGNKATINVNFQPYLRECISQQDMTPYTKQNPFAP